MLRALCHDDASDVADSLKMIVSDNDAMKEKVIGNNMDVNIENLITSHADQLTAEKGRATNENHRKTKALVEASLHQSDHTRNEILKLFNLSKKRYNSHATGIERSVKTCADCAKYTAKECIDLCVHDKIGTRTDTDTFKFEAIDGIKHPCHI